MSACSSYRRTQTHAHGCHCLIYWFIWFLIFHPIIFFFSVNTHPSLYWILLKRNTGMIHTCTFWQYRVQENQFKKEMNRPFCKRTHTDIHADVRHAECATRFSNGMPRLCVCCETSFCCHFFSFLLCNLKPHWLRTHTHTLTYARVPKAAKSPLWLTGCISSYLTPPLLWHSSSVHCLTRVVRCVSAAPPTFKLWPLMIWWIAARLRQGVRHSRIRYKLSLLQGIASHLGSCHLCHAIPTFHSVFPLFFPPVLGLFYFAKTAFSSNIRFDSVFEKKGHDCE